MSVAIIRWELSQRRWYLFWWCVSMVALVAALLAIYPSIHQQAVQLNQVMQQLPASVKALRGGSDLTSPAGYLNSELFYITLPLILIIMSVGLGNSILAKDEQDHTLELLLARPISRGRILAGKAIAALLLVSIVGLVATIATILLSKAVNMDVAAPYTLLTGLGTTVFALAFGAITFTLHTTSLVSGRIGVAIAVIASFGGYLLESLSSSAEVLKTPAKLLPYHYFVPQGMLSGHIARGFIVYMAAIFLIGSVVSYLGFRRRDIS
jgi:ABC-2 type transport system permease protein